LWAGFMILRVWRCKLKSGAGEKFRRFAEETAMPMLRRQDGCLYAVAGVSEDGGEACVVTVWRDLETLKGLWWRGGGSPEYIGERLLCWLSGPLSATTRLTRHST
jgi:hypothetical protein